ncbi:hypothetical protein FNV43_RR18963 [Rhamnella rubrinervis]|uniref:Uncharacterized protein n=1 Tax=Rhamnella rubrinervis TaxID=2594499 RepID=A0A8K0GW40_9ROSA|nr:hypothetical protein FNV43_RR18963 [Rhamnella rubrinervis]
MAIRSFGVRKLIASHKKLLGVLSEVVGRLYEDIVGQPKQVGGGQQDVVGGPLPSEVVGGL